MKCSKCGRDIPDDSLLCCYCGKQIVKGTKQTKRANGLGTAYKRGKSWYIKVITGYKTNDSGKVTACSKVKGGFKTKADALKYADVLLNQSKQPQVKKVPKLHEYWDMYYNTHLEHLSYDKQLAYKLAWKRLQPLYERAVDTITVIELQNIVSSSADTYYKAKDMRTVLSHLFGMAGADGFVSKDLPSYIKLPKLEQKERQPFTEQEQEALWKLYESGKLYAAIPLIMIYTGMMPGQLRSLRVQMIDLQSNKIIGVGLKTKVRKESPIYIPIAIAPVVEKAMEGKTGKVYPYDQKKFYRLYYQALQEAGCRRLSPYSCRHTTATALAINKNIAPQTVRRLMRWSTTAMLQRYAHPDDTTLSDAANSL